MYAIYRRERGAWHARASSISTGMSSKRRRVESTAALESANRTDDFGMFARFAFESPDVSGGTTGPSDVSTRGGARASSAEQAGKSSSMAPYQAAVERETLQPVIASGGSVWRERFSSVCDDCYRSAVHCPHFSETPLTLLIIGHNPSEHTWSTGFPYSNPSNRFWKLLVDGGILPRVIPRGIEPTDRWTPAAANRLPDLLGIGITDVGCEPGSEADKYPRATMLRWRANLFARLRAHRRRAGRAPAVVAFTGVRQFSQLFDPPLKRLGRFGRQTIDDTTIGNASVLPPGWPYRDCSTEVFVLPSSSGRAAFTKEDRLAPYRELGDFLQARRVQMQEGANAGDSAAPSTLAAD